MEDVTRYAEGADLYQVETIADGIRNTGYRSTYNAIAEIVDNSIEANAKNVFVIGNEVLTQNGQKKIEEFAFLDDGEGMTESVLSKCLTIGFSTRRERKGMGRFGVGLPQASFSVAPRVEVYSWNDGVENASRVFIDLDMVTDKVQKKIYGPDKANIPEIYEQYLHLRTTTKTYDFSKHGTLVVWKRCDNVNHRKWNTCSRHMAEDLGRKYRWMINEGDVEISTVEVDDIDTFSTILPNDPLFLMQKSQFCLQKEISDSSCNVNPYNEESGYTEAMFEPFTSEDNETGEVVVPVYYFDKTGEKQTSTVKVKFSIIKEDYYSKNKITRDPGQLPFGQAAKKNAGISIIRQKREIDFGYFDFVDATNNPYHRWWGCEISFTPELDEAFGISNNKQQVILKSIDEDALADFEGDEPMWLQLKPVISSTISQMVKRNHELRQGTRSRPEDPTTTDVSETVNQAEQDNPEIVVEIDDKPTDITEEIIEQVKEELTQEGREDVAELTMDQIKQYLDSNTRMRYVDIGARNAFLDYDTNLGILRVKVNRDNKFYQDFVIKAYQDDDMKLAFELFLVALIKTVYDRSKINPDAMDSLIDGLNDKLKAYLRIDNDKD